MRDKHEIRTELGVKENCFVHCFEFASEVIIAVPVYRYFTCYTVAAAQCRMEEKRHFKVSTYGCIFGNFNYTTQFSWLSLVYALTHARMQLLGSSYCKKFLSDRRLAASQGFPISIFYGRSYLQNCFYGSKNIQCEQPKEP